MNRFTGMNFMTTPASPVPRLARRLARRLAPARPDQSVPPEPQARRDRSDQWDRRVLLVQWDRRASQEPQDQQGRRVFPAARL